MKHEKKLPIGIQSFEEIRRGGYYYVDKTRFVKKLTDEGKYYFLSRPRRFGKSLFLDTLRHAFERFSTFPDKGEKILGKILRTRNIPHRG